MRVTHRSSQSLASLLAGVVLVLAACGDEGSPAEPPPERCGVVRSWVLPARPDRLLRAPGGFVLGPDDSSIMLQWWAVSESGDAPRSFSAAAPTVRSDASLPVGADPLQGRLLSVVVAGEGPAGYLDDVGVQVLVAGGQPGPLQPLGQAFRRGTTLSAQTVSLDGLRAFHVSGHVTAEPPHAFVIDPQGALVAEVKELSPTGGGDLFLCLEVLPTRHGAAVSVLDDTGGPLRWRLTELSASGEVSATELELDENTLDPSRCPRVRLAHTGFLMQLPSADGSLAIHAVGQGQSELRLEAREGPLRTARLIGESSAGQLLLRTAEEPSRVAEVASDGTQRWLDVELPAGSFVASEPERLFMLGDASWDAPQRELFELALDGCQAR
jgi:hypothetical protein